MRCVRCEATHNAHSAFPSCALQAPQLYLELQRQLQAAGHGGGSPRAETRSAQKKKAGVSDVWYDVGGWVTLLALGFGIAALSRNTGKA